MRLGSTVTGRMEIGGGAVIEIPAAALTRRRRSRRSGWSIRQTQTVALQRDRGGALRPRPRASSARGSRPARSWSPPACRRCSRARRCACWGSRPRRDDRPQSLGWALSHRSLVVYLMIVAVGGRQRCPSSGSAATRTRPSPSGPWSCRRPGPAPRSRRRCMQVTERLERTLQETPEPRLAAQLHRAPAQTTIFVNLKGSDHRRPRCRTSGTRCASASAISATRCRRAWSGPASTTISATPSASSTASPPTASPIASCATRSRPSAPACCSVPDVSKVEILGAQDEEIFVEFSTEQLAGLGLDRGALIAALQAQNLVRPAGADRRPATSASSLRVSGAFEIRAGHPGDQFRRRRPDDPAGRHRRSPPRLRRPAAADVPGQRPAGDRPRHRHARRRRHPGARQATCSGTMAAITADLPIGIEPLLVADQAGHGRRRHRRVHGIAVAGDRDHPGGQLQSASASGPARSWRCRSR